MMHGTTKIKFLGTVCPVTERKSQKTWITNAKHAKEKVDQESATEQPTM